MLQKASLSDSPPTGLTPPPGPDGTSARRVLARRSRVSHITTRLYREEIMYKDTQSLNTMIHCLT